MTPDSVASSWLIFPDATKAGLISKVELNLVAAGKVYIATFSQSGGTFTRKQMTVIHADAGYASLLPGLLTEDGDHIGIYTESGLYFDTGKVISGRFIAGHQPAQAKMGPLVRTLLPENTITPSRSDSRRYRMGQFLWLRMR